MPEQGSGAGDTSVRRECHTVFPVQCRERDQTAFKQLNDGGFQTPGAQILASKLTRKHNYTPPDQAGAYQTHFSQGQM